MTPTHAISLGIILVAAACPAAELPSAPAVLDLPADGFAAGWLLDSPPAERGQTPALRWQAAGFESPWTFDVDRVAGMRLVPTDAEASPEVADLWQVHLVSGDILVGMVPSLDAQWLHMTLRTAAGDRDVRVKREAVAALVRGGRGGVDWWSDGQAGWRMVGDPTWSAEGGGLTARDAGAAAHRAVDVGPRVCYELVWSWEQLPTLRIAWGEPGTPQAGAPYRLELSPQGSAAVREEAPPDKGMRRTVDLRPFQLPTGATSSLKMTVFIDQRAGRLVVMQSGGGVLADVTLPPARDATHQGGITLKLIEGRATLLSLRASPWMHEDLTTAVLSGPGVRLRDGRLIDGEVATILEGQVTMVAADGQVPVTAEWEGVDLLQLTTGAAPRVSQDGPAWVRATDVAGLQFTGRWSHVAEGVLWLSHPALDKPLDLPVQRLASVVPLRPASSEAKLPGRAGRLTCDTAEVVGCLVPVAGGGAGLAFQPAGSDSGSKLSRTWLGGTMRAVLAYDQVSTSTKRRQAVGGLAATIQQAGDGRFVVTQVARDQPLRQHGVEDGHELFAIDPRGEGNWVNAKGRKLHEISYLLYGPVGSQLNLRFVDANGGHRIATVNRRKLPRVSVTLEEVQAMQEQLMRGEGVPVPADDSPRASLLVLRSGETLACAVERITEEAVVVRMAGGEPTAVRHEVVQAVELVQVPPRGIALEKAHRLLTLPRSQRDSPPTHLLRSPRGDYLRGRLVGLDDKAVRFVVEASPDGRPMTLDRADVARIIWLHPPSPATQPDVEAAPAAAPSPPPREGVIVEARSAEDLRLGMLAQRVDGDVLMGLHPWLGPCRLDLATLDSLSLGTLGDVPAERAYSQWQWKPAPDPRNLPPSDAPSLDPPPPPPPAWSWPEAEARARISPAELRRQAAELIQQRDRRALWYLGALLAHGDVKTRREAAVELGRIAGPVVKATAADNDSGPAEPDEQAAMWRRWIARESPAVKLQFEPAAEASPTPVPRVRRVLDPARARGEAEE